jgi:predicted Zn-dependent peptidase
MRGKPVWCAIAASAAILMGAAPLRAAGSIEVIKRPNGPEIVLDRREGSDVVCVMVAVHAGSSCETPDTRGATHFIEHLAFDGSERYSREEISGWIDDVGGFLNAFTRKETTVFFLLVPSAHFEKGIDILSQMLLHSTFLPEEIEKERKVIAEEIRRERDDPGASLEGVVDRALYRGTSLTEPVIGYPETIRAMSDSALTSFYRTFYRPSNMRIVIMGSFVEKTAEALVDGYFPTGSAAKACGAATRPEWKNEIAVDSVAGGEPGFDALVPLPAVGESDFPAALLVAKMLEGESSPLAKKLAAIGLPAPEVDLEIHGSFAALRIHVGAAEEGRGTAGMGMPMGMGAQKGAPGGGGAPAPGRAAYEKIPAAIESLASWAPSPAELEKARVSYLSGEMFDREMYHFYIMSRGDAIALHGARYLEQSDGTAGVAMNDCLRVLKSLQPLRFNASLIEAGAAGGRSAPKPGAPGMPPGMGSGMPPGMGSKMPGAPAASPGMASQAPAAPPSKAAMKQSGAAIPPPAVRAPACLPVAVETLPTGCTFATLTRALSPVSALHILLRGRACCEGAAPTGAPELLMTALKLSASRRGLATRLDSLGARVSYGDNPYVPQDDYLLSPAFAFIRIEAPAGSIAEAARLVLGNSLSSITQQDLDEAKKSLAREVGMRSGAGAYTMRTAMWAALFGAHPFAAPLFPAPPVIAKAGIEHLEALLGRLFTGGNVIATLVSPEVSGGSGRDELREILIAGFPQGAPVECPALPDSAEATALEKGTAKETAYIAAGWLARTESPAGTAAVLVASEILSRRMQLELREKRGLAYSIECVATPLPGGAVVIAYLGTGAQRLDEARAALEEEVRALGTRAPDAAEVEIAKNRLLGKRGRSELSSINAAYALGFDLLLCGDLPYEPMKGLVAAAAAGDVRGAVETIMAWDRASVLRLVPEAAPGKPSGPEAPRGK